MKLEINIKNMNAPDLQKIFNSFPSAERSDKDVFRIVHLHNKHCQKNVSTFISFDSKKMTFPAGEVVITCSGINTL